MGRKLLYVEGKDEVEFFEALKKEFTFEFEIINCESKDKMKIKIMDDLQSTGSIISSLAIIHDEDGKGEEAICNKIQGIFEACNCKDYPKLHNAFAQMVSRRRIIRTGFFIVTKMLEDLLLDTISSDIKSCIKGFINCVNQTEKVHIKNESKSKLRAFLALYMSDENCTPNIRNAVKGNLVNFKSVELNKLKTFLEEFAK